MVTERWLSAAQKKGIGKYLKPWGQQPTKATFWIQIITSAVVLLVSLGAAAEQGTRNPGFVALIVSVILVGIIFGYGYWKMKRTERLEEEAAAAAAAEEAAAEAEKEAKEKEATEEGAEEKADGEGGEGGGPKIQGPSDDELRRMFLQMRAQMEGQQKQLMAQLKAAGCPEEEIGNRVKELAHRQNEEMNARRAQIEHMRQAERSMVEQGATAEQVEEQMKRIAMQHQHAWKVKMEWLEDRAKTRQELYRAGAPAQIIEEKVAECDRRHQAEWERQKTREKALQAELQQIQEAARAEGCSPAEIQERIQARVQKHQDELKAEAAAKAKARPEWEKEVAAAKKPDKPDKKSQNAELQALLKAGRVQISGVKARPELNGRVGVAERYNEEKARFVVSVEPPEGDADGKPEQVLLKPSNLTPIGGKPASPAAAAPNDDDPPPLE